MQKKQFNKYLFYVRAGVFILLVLFVLLFHSTSVWKRNFEVSCVNTGSFYKLPFTNKLVGINPLNHSARLYEFVDEYIENKYSENVSDFYIHDATNQNVAHSTNLLKAMSQSKGKELKRIQKKYIESADRFLVLKKKNYATRTKLHAIEYLMPTALMGTYRVGAIIEIYAVSGDINPVIEGHHRVELIISQEEPLKDTKGKFLNEKGLFVVDSRKTYMTSYEFFQLIRRIPEQNIIMDM